MSGQLDLLAPLRAGLCQYGELSLTGQGSCDRSGRFGARWGKDGETGGRDCCLDHANYYAVAWCPHYPAERSSAWLDLLDGRCSDCGHHSTAHRVFDLGLSTRSVECACGSVWSPLPPDVIVGP